MKVRYTPRAVHDVEAILAYLNDRNPLVLNNLKRAFESTERLISQFPRGGKVSDASSTHVLPAGRYPYLVYWTIEAGEAWIVHIRDGRRKPWRGE
jgi:plasmid stabilization system protein ParE